MSRKSYFLDNGSIRFRLIDSYSDGMCGWVEVFDAKTNRSTREHWDVFKVYPNPNSQTRAFDEAAERLLEKDNG